MDKNADHEITISIDREDEKMKTNKIISMILNNSRINKKNDDNPVYTDEPIIYTAAQMKNYLPPKYREMKKIAKSRDAYRTPYEQIFYKQGKFMEDFEDDYAYYGTLNCYFPTYQVMNDFQLRGYFSWRTKVRHGQIEKTSLSFFYLYAYELINQIGVLSPVDGFEKLQSIWSAYRVFEPSIDRNVKQWLIDYAVYYNLPPSVIEPLNCFSENTLSALQEYKTRPEAELFETICAFSSYNIENSAFYKKYPEDFKTVVCRVFAAESDYAQAHRKNSYFEHLFGKVQNMPYWVFSNVPFYDRKKYQNYAYHASAYSSYTCLNGKWKHACLPEPLHKSKELGQMIRATDAILRSQTGFTPLLQEPPITKLMRRMISQQIELWQREKAQRERQRVDIDLSKLEQIRRAADATRDKLLVEEESPTPLQIRPQEPPAPIAAPTMPAIENPENLSESEITLLRCLLQGENSERAMHERGLIPSVVAESINEKLFDRFGDIVIDYNGEQAVLIEDYIEDLKGLVLP